ncbi:MAG: hypothetical protein IJ191_05445 [Treponema sp.]|nr:hypothetical protein [Treponema sp.]
MTDTKNRAVSVHLKNALPCAFIQAIYNRPMVSPCEYEGRTFGIKTAR